jgi:hypothetical protein
MDDRFGEPTWNTLKAIQFLGVIPLWFLWLITFKLYKKMGWKKYFCLVVSVLTLLGILVYRRAKNSCRGKGWTLDNFYRDNKPFYNNKYPHTQVTDPKYYEVNDHIKNCKMAKTGICWHYFAEGWAKPLVMGRDECNSSKILNMLEN